MYKQLSSEDLSTLETCQLLSLHEQLIKRANSHKDCLQRLLDKCPPLRCYVSRNVVPWPADWPGWYYPKKLIATGQINGTKCGVIPEVEQFHVSLNAAEDTVTISHHFFDKLFKSVFGTELSQKPRPYKVTLCLTAALLVWLQVRQKVTEKFGLCKDYEYVSVVYLLEHVIPLVFFQYNTFRGGDMAEYEGLMIQMAILFICWNRKKYNKSTLSYLSDNEYQKVFLPTYWQQKLKYFYLISEKKVDVFHSLLRENSTEYDDGSSLEKTGKVIASSNFLSAFKEWFVPTYQRGCSESNLWLIVGKSAQFFLQLFETIAQNS